MDGLPSHFWTKQLRLEELKKNFLETEHPPYLRVWMTPPPLISRSGSSTDVHLVWSSLELCSLVGKEEKTMASEG